VVYWVFTKRQIALSFMWVCMHCYFINFLHIRLFWVD